MRPLASRAMDYPRGVSRCLMEMCKRQSRMHAHCRIPPAEPSTEEATSRRAGEHNSHA